MPSYHVQPPEIAKKKRKKKRTTSNLDKGCIHFFLFNFLKSPAQRELSRPERKKKKKEKKKSNPRLSKQDKKNMIKIKSPTELDHSM